MAIVADMRIFPKLFLIIAATSALSALAMTGVLAISLQRGFAGYLEARDTELMLEFGATFDRVASEASKSPADSGNLGKMMIGMAAAGQVPEAPPHFAPMVRDLPLPLPPGRRVRPPTSFAMRIMVFDPDGRQVVGPRPPKEPEILANTLVRPIRAGERVIGTIQLLPRGPSGQEIEAQFLASQYVNAAIISGLLIALAAIVAFLLARRGVRQLGAVQQAAATIARGDLTARVPVRGSDELAEMATDINRMGEALQNLEAVRRRWLAEIGHELRTPLTVLGGELAALRDGVRKLDMAAIESLSEESQRLNLLVDDLHFLAMSDLSAQPCIRLACNGFELVERVAQRFAPMTEQAGLQLVCELPRESIAVCWDPMRIEQLLANLLINSIRYTDKPGEIRISATAAQESVIVTVEDSLPGVPQEQLASLFDPLFRLQEARDRASGGSGLGLAVSAAIAAAHGGAIKAEPSRLGGVRMIVTLPHGAEPSQEERP
jgi:two-component system, OmpR family, sensor histidine kinase BaeS